MTEEEMRRMEQEFKRAEEELLNFLKFGSFGGSRQRGQGFGNSQRQGYNPFENTYNQSSQGGYNPDPFSYPDPIAEMKRRAFANIFIFVIFFLFLISLFRNPNNKELEQSYASKQRKYNPHTRETEYVLVLDNRTGQVFETTVEEYKRLQMNERGRFASQGSVFR